MSLLYLTDLGCPSSSAGSKSAATAHMRATALTVGKGLVTIPEICTEPDRRLLGLLIGPCPGSVWLGPERLVACGGVGAMRQRTSTYGAVRIPRPKVGKGHTA